MSTTSTAAVLENRLLAALPTGDYQRLQPHLKLVTLALRQPIYASGEPINAVYFPLRALISLVTTLADGSTMEVGLVGHEGMAGVPVLLGGQTTAHYAFVQLAGEAWQLPTAILQAEFQRGGALQTLLLRYVQSLMTQTSQTGVCNRFHSTEERLARWLLLVSDCLRSESFALTQEFIGQMVGVNRSGVTVAAGALAQAGLIQYSRGQIAIIDRPGLEDFACECYSVVRQEQDWLYALAVSDAPVTAT